MESQTPYHSDIFGEIYATLEFEFSDWLKMITRLERAN